MLMRSSIARNQRLGIMRRENAFLVIISLRVSVRYQQFRLEEFRGTGKHWIKIYPELKVVF